MTCAIIDDEPLALDLLESYIRKTPFLQLCGRYSSAVEAIAGLGETPVELIFCDIQMPELNGLDFARSFSGEAFVIFTTAFSQYALEGFKVNAIDYLLKPVSYTDFLTAASKAQRWAEQKKADGTDTAAANESLFIKSDYKLIRIAFRDILYVEGLKDYVKIYVADNPRPYFSLTSMKSVEERLPAPGFFRIHRSFIVNMDKVSVVERGHIVFGDKRLPISDSYKEKVQQYINARLLSR